MYKANNDIIAMVSPKSWAPGLPVSVSGTATVHVDYSHCARMLVNAVEVSELWCSLCARPHPPIELSQQCIQKKMPFPILIFYSQIDEKLISNFAVPTIIKKYGIIILLLQYQWPVGTPI